MTTLVLERDPIAERVEVTPERLVVHLTDGRMFAVPIDWFPRLQHATPEERANWQLIGDGYAVEWPDLDEHVGVEGLLAGRRSGESERSLRKWLDERGPHHMNGPAVVNLPEYRRRRGADTWHFCRNCSWFPTSDFEVVESEPAGEVCNECRAKLIAGKCG